MKNNAAKNTTVSLNLLLSKFCVFSQNFRTRKLGEITYLITTLEPFQIFQWQKMLVLRKPDVFLSCWKISPSKVQFYTQFWGTYVKRYLRRKSKSPTSCKFILGIFDISIVYLFLLRLYDFFRNFNYWEIKCIGTRFLLFHIFWNYFFFSDEVFLNFSNLLDRILR